MEKNTIFQGGKRKLLEYRYLKLLIFWPVFGLAFTLLENFPANMAYHVIHCGLDDLIPFCEAFILPYELWFPFVPAMLLWLFLKDADGFCRMMWFVIFTYGSALVICWIYPSCQNLRPEGFAHDNIFTRMISSLYSIDTNTNVFPSLHVNGALAVVFASWHTKTIHQRWWKIIITMTGILISVSTVFVKQHSVLDVLASLVLCALVYLLVYRTDRFRVRTVPNPLYNGRKGENTGENTPAAS